MATSRTPRRAAGILLALLCLTATPSFGDPVNRCLESRVRIGESLVAAPDALFDGNEASALKLATRGPEACEMCFVGAPRWFYRVDVLTDARGVTVEILDLDSTWRAFGSAEAAPPAMAGGAAEAQWLATSGPAEYARGLRIVSAAEARLFEISATFDARDPDKAGLPIDAAGFNYHADWVNLYPGAGNDLSDCDDDAEGLENKLPGSWDKWLHGDYNAYEDHFKRTDLGGTNPDHTDNADLAYFSGHGSTGTDLDGTSVRVLLFGDSSFDDNNLVPGEADGAWDADMEWMGFMNCRTMEDADRWHDAMEGVHLILGFETVSLDVNFGKYFGKYMVDSGIGDSAEKVKTSWFDAAEETHGAGYTAKVIGETSSMGNDYLHGEGTVQADPTHDATYTSWSFNTTAAVSRMAEAPSMGTLWPHPVASLTNPVTFSTGTDRGITVVIDQSLLDAPATVSMPVFDVVPVMVDSAYVRVLANRLCAQGGHLCGGDILPGDPSELNLIDGPYELRVSLGTGALHYHDANRWMAWRTTAPELPVGSEAIQSAEQLLENLGRRRADAAVAGVDYVWQSAEVGGSLTMASEIPESTFAVASRVVYRRELGANRPVAGPGGSMTVAFGDNGICERIFEGGWRKVMPGNMVDIVPVNAAVNHLSMHGSDGTVEGIGPFAYSIQVDSWELGYYEYGRDVPQNTIRPVYIFHTTITETPPGVTPPVYSQQNICLWAEALPPDAEILSPADGTCVPPGSTVCFQGSANGGIPPYQFSWRDDVTGEVLGNGANLCAAIDGTPPGHSEADMQHTITLTVRDALGRVAHDAVQVCLLAATSVADGGSQPAATAHPLFEAILPNPTLGSVRMRFSAPLSGEYSVQIFDVAGRRVRSLAPEVRGAGSYALDWDGRSEAGETVSPGVYYARLQGAGASAMKRIVVVR